MREKDHTGDVCRRCRTWPTRATERLLRGKSVPSFLSARKQGPWSHNCKEQTLLVTWMSLEVDSSYSFLLRASQLTLSFWPCEIQSREPSWINLDYWSIDYNIINLYCLKLFVVLCYGIPSKPIHCPGIPPQCPSHFTNLSWAISSKPSHLNF